MFEVRPKIGATGFPAKNFSTPKFLLIFIGVRVTLILGPLALKKDQLCNECVTCNVLCLVICIECNLHYLQCAMCS